MGQHVELITLLVLIFVNLITMMLVRKNGSHIESVLKQEVYKVMDTYVDKIRKQAERSVDKGRTRELLDDDSPEAQFNSWLKEQNVYKESM